MKKSIFAVMCTSLIPSICLSIFLLPIAAEAATPLKKAPPKIARAFFRDTTIWPSNNIPVCWESLADSTVTERQLVQTAIKNTWEAHSIVRFTGWTQECPNPLITFRGIRIAVTTLLGLGARSVLGTEGMDKDYLVGGMVLNFDLNTKSYSTFDDRFITVGQRCAEAGNNLNQCIQLSAVHEFGHALGLAHEQNRADDPGTTQGKCHTKDTETTRIFPPYIYNLWGNTYFTDYDLDSIMNYCRPNYFGRNYYGAVTTSTQKSTSMLSDIDKLAVKVYYGNIPSYDSNTGILTIPQIMYYGASYKAKMQWNGELVFTELTPTDGTKIQNQSSVTSTYSYPYMTLPLVKIVSNGKVTQLMQWNIWNSYYYHKITNTYYSWGFNEQFFTLVSSPKLQPTK